MKYNARFLQANFINEMSYFDQMSEEIYEKLMPELFQSTNEDDLGFREVELLLEKYVDGNIDGELRDHNKAP